MKKNTYGFSLIELLVVIAIMAVLAGLSTFGLQGAREAGRDGKRKADLESLRSALEIYRSDCGHYPINTTGGDFNTLYGGSGFTDADGTLCGTGTREYIRSGRVPQDPSSGHNYYYESDTNGMVYWLCAALETEQTESPDCTAVGANCGAGLTCSYFVGN